MTHTFTGMRTSLATPPRKPTVSVHESDDRPQDKDWAAGLPVIGNRTASASPRAIDGSWAGMTTSEIAARVGKSLSSVSAYFAEINAADSALIGSRGRTRFIASPASAAEQLTTFERMERFMTSPVKRRMCLACGGAMPTELSRLPLSGVSALSKCTIIAADPWETRAVASPSQKTPGATLRTEGLSWFRALCWKSSYPSRSIACWARLVARAK